MPYLRRTPNPELSTIPVKSSKIAAGWTQRLRASNALTECANEVGESSLSLDKEIRGRAERHKLRGMSSTKKRPGRCPGSKSLYQALWDRNRQTGK